MTGDGPARRRFAIRRAGSLLRHDGFWLPLYASNAFLHA